MTDMRWAYREMERRRRVPWLDALAWFFVAVAGLGALFVASMFALVFLATAGVGPLS